MLGTKISQNNSYIYIQYIYQFDGYALCIAMFKWAPSVDKDSYISFPVVQDFFTVLVDLQCYSVLCNTASVL